MDARAARRILRRIVIAIAPSTATRRSAIGMVALAACSGLVMGLAVSGGIVGERLTSGMLAVGLAANAMATASALLAARVALRRARVASQAPSSAPHARVVDGQLHPLVLLAPQAIGAAVGVAVVHVLLRHGVLGSPGWLSEAPAQLVNDAVGVFALLTVAWACAMDMDRPTLVLALVVVSIYRATASCWHLDRAPAAPQTTVQQFVVAEFVAAALALGLASFLRRRDADEAG